MDSDKASGCEYIPEILHQPKNPEGPVKDVMNLLNTQLRVSIDDGRTFIGTFTAFDKFGNIVLTDAVEEFREDKREMSMVIVPLSSAKSIGSRPLPAENETN